MAKLPNPPPASQLRTLPPDIHILPAGTTLWRVYFRSGRYTASWNTFRSYGPVPTGRFDHYLAPPRDQDRKIYYAAYAASTCLAEFFQRTRTINRTRKHPALVVFELTADISLLSLCENWPTRAGASMALSTGSRIRAQRWSRVIYEAYPAIHGLWYPSSMDANRPAVALYERAQQAVPNAYLFHYSLTDPKLDSDLRRVANALNYRWL